VLSNVRFQGKSRRQWLMLASSQFGTFRTSEPRCQNVRFGGEVEVPMTRIAVRPLNHLGYCP
jgi:hypothetical protein